MRVRWLGLNLQEEDREQEDREQEDRDLHQEDRESWVERASVSSI
jgi:hypothetical protein